MLITKKKDILFYLRKIERNGHVYVVNQGGGLEINSSYSTFGYLLYQNGRWYSSMGARKGSSEPILEKGKILFGLANNCLCILTEVGNAEYSTATTPLEEDMRVFLFAEQDEGLCLTIIDGKKSKVPYTLTAKPDLKTAHMMATIVIALTRQYDSDAADQMESFWFCEEDPFISDSNTDKTDDSEDTPLWYEFPPLM